MKLNTIETELGQMAGLGFLFGNDDTETVDSKRLKVVPHQVLKELGDDELLKQTTAEVIIEIMTTHVNAHRHCANLLYDLKQAMEGTKAWSKLLESNCLPYSAHTVRDLVKARDWLNSTAEDATWQEIQKTLGFRTLRIISNAESEQLEEIKQLAAAGKKITETLADTVVRKKMPVDSEHRKLRAVARDTEQARTHATRKVEEHAQWWQHYELQLRQMKESLIDLPQRGMPPQERFRSSEGIANLCNSLKKSIVEEALRYADTDELLEMQAFIEARLLANKQQRAADNNAITVDAVVVALPGS
jgi:hypothetical protein